MNTSGMTPPIESADELSAFGTAGVGIELPIADGSATGYSWTLELPPNVLRIDDGPVRRETATSSAPGAARGGALRVMAPAGEYLVHARLARPWDPDHPIRTVTIRVQVAGAAPVGGIG